MPVTLPYAFDTLGGTRMVVRASYGFGIVVLVPGIIYSILVKRSVIAALQLVLLTGMIALFVYIALNYLKGAVGTITHEAVSLRRASVLGLDIPGPAGTLPIAQFSAVRVEQISRRVDITPSTRRHERVWLVGKMGAPDVLVARTSRGEGIVLAEELGRALQLPTLRVRRPY